MSQQIEEIINRINRKWGYQTVRPASQLTPVQSKIETGFAGLDMLLQGIARGHITELAGRATSGMTTLVHHVAIQAQIGGDNVVYIQYRQPLDGQYIAECGVRLDKMLSVDVDSLSGGLAVAQGIIASQHVGLVILNLSGLRQRHLDLKRLLHDLRGADCALIVLLPSFAQSNGAAVRLSVHRQKWLQADGQIIGCLSSVTLQKNRFGQSGNHVLLLIPLIQEAWQ